MKKHLPSSLFIQIRNVRISAYILIKEISSFISQLYFLTHVRLSIQPRQIFANMFAMEVLWKYVLFVCLFVF